MSGEGKTRSDWNLALLNDVVAPLYARLIAELRQKVGTTASTIGSTNSSTGEESLLGYYSFFPSPEEANKQFGQVAVR